MVTNWEMFNRQMQTIHERVEYIAKRTANMAVLGTANSDNQDFVELMRLQQELHYAAEKLIEKYTKLDPSAKV